MDGASNGQWSNEQGAFVLTCLLHAVALIGADMRTVVRCASDFADPEPARILREDPRAPLAWAAQFLTVDSEPGGQDRRQHCHDPGRAAAPAASPKVLEAVCPEVGEEFDAIDFLERSGTLYVLSTSGGRSAARLITVLIDHVVETAKHLSQRQTGGRLDPTLRLVLDEAPQVAPLPDLPGLTADSGGRVIAVVVYAQTAALMRQRWGDDGAKGVWDAASTTMIFGGIKDAGMLVAGDHLPGAPRRLRPVRATPDRQTLHQQRRTRRPLALHEHGVGAGAAGRAAPRPATGRP